MIVNFVNHNKGVKPNISLTIRRVTGDVWYSLGFHKHHYLSHDLNKSAQCFLFEWGTQAVAFVAILNNPAKGKPYNLMVSRLVVLPDFQGLGLSTRILSFIGGIYKAKATQEKPYQLYIKTAHEKMGNALGGNTNWIGSSTDMRSRYNDKQDKNHTRFRRCFSFCKKYVGEPIYGYEDLLKPIDEMRYDRNDQLAHQFTLW